MPAWPEGLEALAASLFPGGRLEKVERLAPDAAPGAEDEKALGYGKPLKVTVRLPGGAARTVVFRTQLANEYGHDRRADRVDAALLAYDLFDRIPAHVRALDVGLVGADGRLVSLRGAGEPYLVTEWAEGTLYAEDLRRVARTGRATPLDLARASSLAAYLVRLHAERRPDRAGWRRALRDLLGHGEGIFGVADAYPDDVPGAPRARLEALERRCLAWRWKLRDRSDRLARTHGDFHPFNVVFAPRGPGEDGTRFTLLDASRGGQGDPADDVVALTVNYAFFALDRRRAWADALGALWDRFWRIYLEGSGDRAVLDAAPPYLAWRALVLASPRFYPHLSAAGRDAILTMAERALDAGRLDLGLPGDVLMGPTATPTPRDPPSPPAQRSEAWGERGHDRSDPPLTLALSPADAGDRGRRADVTPPASPGAIVWVTGLPSSGKSTFARALRDRLAAQGRAAALLDGDDVRAALSPPPGFDPASREAFYETLGDLALLVARSGVVAIVAATAHRRAFRDRVRARAARFVEVHVDAPADVCAARDPKQLWARARAGDLPGLPGAGVTYEPPLAPEVVAHGGEDGAALDEALAALERAAERRA